MIWVTYFLCTCDRQHFGKVRTRGATHSERVQTPIAALVTKTENAAEIIREDDSSKPSTIESRCLENVFVPVCDLLSLISQGDAFGFHIRLTFINFKQFVGDVLRTTIQGQGNFGPEKTYIMVSVEQHEEHADGRQKEHKTVLGKRVGKHHSAAPSASASSYPSPSSPGWLLTLPSNEADCRRRYFCLRANNNGSRLPTKNRVLLMLLRPLRAIPFPFPFLSNWSGSGSGRETRRPHALRGFPINTYRCF